MNTLFSEKIGWEVERHPVSFERNGKLITDPNFMVLSRSDNEQVLSVMSKKYCPMKVEEFEKATARMQEVSGMEMKGFQEFNDGKILLSILKNKEPLLVNSYPIDDYLVMGTSFNGEQPFFIGTSTILIRCQNSFSHIHPVSRIRHTRFSFERREEVLSGLETYLKNREGIYTNFARMQEVDIQEEDKELFVNQILPLPEGKTLEEVSVRTLNRRASLMECIEGETSELGNNVFGLFQGLTKFTSHVFQAKKEAPFANLIGTANDLNQRGYRYALNKISGTSAVLS